MLRLTNRRAALAVSLWLLAAATLLAEPTLVRLVPIDAGLCVCAEDAAAHVDRFLAGPLHSRLREYSPLVEWRREHGAPLKRIAGDVGRQLGVELKDVWRGIFGRQTVLAVWPPEDLSQKQGPGLLLVEADDAELLNRLVAGVRDAQQRAGEVLETRQANHRGLAYEERRIRHKEKEEQIYLAVLDRIGVLATQESLLLRVLDLHLAQRSPGKSLAQLPAFQESLQQVDADAPVKLFINPRSWDAILSQTLPEGKPKGIGQRLVAQTWKSVEYAVFAAAAHPQARAEGFIAWHEQADASDLNEVRAALSGPSSMLERIPADTLAAAAGQIDVSRLLRWLHSGDAPNAPRKRGLPEVIWSLVDGTFQGLGPGFGGYLAAPREGSEFPLSAAAGMQIQSRVMAQPNAALKPADSLRSLLQAAVALSPPREGQPVPQLKSHAAGDTEVLSLIDLADVPQGLSPSFAFDDSTMFVGVDAHSVEQAATLKPADSLAASPAFQQLLGPRLKSPTHASYANLARLRQWLKADGERLAAVLSGNADEPSESALRGLEQLSALLQVADLAAAAAQIDAKGIRLSAAAAVEE